MGMLFDKYKVLHGLPNVGQKIKFREAAKFAFLPQTAQAEFNLLEKGREYTVRKVQLNSSTTYVWLEEFPEVNGSDVFFNMHSFDWEPPTLNPDELIGFYSSHLSVLQYKLKLGIEVNGELQYEGHPTLVVTVDDTTKIIKAEIKQQ